MNFQQLIGQNIEVAIPRFCGDAKLLTVKLHGVEAGGLWIESQDVTNMVLANLGQQSSPQTLVWFVPYHEIVLVMHSIDQPALNEKAYGI